MCIGIQYIHYVCWKIVSENRCLATFHYLLKYIISILEIIPQKFIQNCFVYIYIATLYYIIYVILGVDTHFIYIIIAGKKSLSKILHSAYHNINTPPIYI